MKMIFRSLLLLAALLTQITVWAVTDVYQVKGRVKDTKGKPVVGVVLSDGCHFTTTDADGCYVLDTDPKRFPLVYLSTPAAYELPQENGIAAGFYQSLDPEKKVNQCDFVLEKREKPSDKFIYIPISDPQVKNMRHLDRFRLETVPDLRHTADSLSHYEIIGMGLGDLVWDAMDLYAPYKEAVSNLGMTMFQCIGNHDFNLKYSDLERTGKVENGYGEQNYQQAFGPTDYSFNIGKVHVVVMKDIDYEGGKNYVERFTDAQLEWLRRDLSYVPEGSLVFLNVHAPVANTTVPAGYNTRNSNALFQILRPYEVHIFSGHTHFYENSRPAPTIYEHNIGAACGAWWAGHVNRCGAPNGYLIVHVDGDSLSWRYKATAQGSDYQMRIYAPGTFETQPDYVVANIWDWDMSYVVNWYENGRLMGAMQQFEDEDQDCIQMRNGKRTGYATRHLFRACPSKEARTVTVEVKNRFGETFEKTIFLDKYKPARVIAHRGFWKTDGSAQNSLTALRKSAESGVYGSEFDVLMTADGVIVVNHDDTIAGYTIEDTPYKKIRDQKIKNGETLPTLRSYLEEGKLYPELKLILEIKPHKKKKNEDKAVRRIVALVEELGLSAQVEYISFSLNVCEQLVRETPESEVYYLNGDLTPRMIKAKGFAGMDYHYKTLENNPGWVAEAHRLGLKVNCWTVNQDLNIGQMVRMGVDFITTDRPVDVLQMVD